MIAHRQQGTTLVEVMIGLVIVALLFALGTPAFFSWLQNSQIRTSAEAIQNGLHLARGEAVRRNTSVRFQLTSAVTASCGLSTAGANWVVSLDNPAGACNSAPSDTVAPRIIQIRSAAEGSANAVVAAGQATITFNGLGRVTPVPAGDIDIDISNPTGGACATAGVDGMRCLRIRVSTGGQIRMCNPILASTDPQGC
ncbi:MAG: prepilin-type N-terminal cleavage/methylation domain-containing protein [Rhodocyclaceae bacterium]|nr:MAG: prepilin-type N-terminal cleavage/methylation domain-containing protein [Rhodocyclaceae bacterium]